MDLFLLNCLLLAWASAGAARRLAAAGADQIMAAALLAWGNLVVTGLLLSCLGRLGDPAWFFSVSGLLGGLTFLLLLRVAPEPPPDPTTPAASPANPWGLAALAVTLIPLALAAGRIAWTYAPNNADTLAIDLPRVMYYLGQGSLAPFPTADLRQTFLPFNGHLLLAFGSVYGAPPQCLNLCNLAAWALAGLAVHRLCRLGGGGAGASLLAVWLVLTAAPVLALANSTAVELPAGAALVCAVVFGRKWTQSHRAGDAALAGLAAGLAAGSSLGVLFLGALAGLVGLAFAWRHARQAGIAPGLAAVRPWIGPAVLAGVLLAPFALVNLAGPGRWLDTFPALARHRSWADTVQEFRAGFLPLLGRPAPHTALNEDTAGFGLAGLLFLAGAGGCLFGFRRPGGLVRWLAGLGLGWILAIAALRPWLSSSLRDFVPAFLLLAPCAAVVIGHARAGRPELRLAGSLVLAAAGLTGGWSAGVYLLHNTSRPLLPLGKAVFVPPAWPVLPMLLEHRLSPEPRINVETDGVDECIYPLLAVGRNQRFTSQGKPDPAVYTLISRAGSSRPAADLGDSSPAFHALVPVSTKRTAGVEFLATIGSGGRTRDYFGLAPRTAPMAGNRNLLVTLYRELGQRGAPDRARLRVAGMNPADQVRLTASLVPADGQAGPVAVLTADGESVFPFPGAARHLDLLVLDSSSGAELGRAVLPAPSAAESFTPAGSLRPSGADSVFVTDLVLAPDNLVVASEGLTLAEGPFPQWDIPRIRWARQPAFTLRIPAVPGLARVQLSFSARLHVRKKAALEVVWNGRVVQSDRLEGQAVWLDRTLDLPAAAGENLLEFRDAPLVDEPDWMDYLERYPDIKNYFDAMGIPLEEGAREHYEKVGRSEGRTVKLVTKTVPAPGSFYFLFRNLRLEGFRSP
jgi:hypothetical protein